jgi:hypothetical protein
MITILTPKVGGMAKIKIGERVGGKGQREENLWLG